MISIQLVLKIFESVIFHLKKSRSGKKMQFLIVFISFIIQLNLVYPVNEKPRIAIIGSGISGAACAMFVNEKLGLFVEIHIYESDKEGGRINTIIHKGNAYELGAQTILQEDKLIGQYVKFFKLKKIYVNKNKPIYAITDGQKLKQMKWIYKLDKGFKVSEIQYQWLSTKVDYEKYCYTYTSVLDMLKLISTKEYSFLRSARAQECLKSVFYGRDYILKECEALLLMVYGQIDNVPPLTGYFTVKSVQSGAYSIEGGNIQLIEKFLNRSMPQNKYKETVISIRSLTAENEKKRSKRKNQNKKFFNFQIISVDAEKKIQERNYDFVVLANPLSENMENPITFLDFSEKINNVRGEFHKKFITILEGDLDSHYFNENKDLAETAGNIIFRNDGNIDFISKLGSVKVEDDNKSSISMCKKEDGVSTSKSKGNSILFKTSSKKSNNKKDMTISEIGIWKIQSKKKLSDEEIEKLFQRRTIIAEKEWLAYPNYKEYNLDENDGFIMSSGLYYINCIEWITSSIEMSIVGAKNVAAKIADRVYIHKRK